MPVQQDPEEELLYIEENFCEIHWLFSRFLQTLIRDVYRLTLQRD